MMANRPGTHFLHNGGLGIPSRREQVRFISRVMRDGVRGYRGMSDLCRTGKHGECKEDGKICRCLCHDPEL